jgi:GH15 family glucan-1,4-alpha-glucosidase
LSRAGLSNKSIDVICSLQEEDGGILATKGDDAYPFVYPRDASFMTMALNMYGMFDKSKNFYRFIAKATRPRGEIYQRYNRGYPYVTQKGEADVAPIVIQGIYDTYRASGDLEFLRSMWDVTADGIGYVLAKLDSQVGLVNTTRSVHENRTLEKGFEIWANSAAVKGLLDASRTAQLLGHDNQSTEWKRSAGTLWKRMKEKLYDEETGLFIKNLRSDGSRLTSPDVAQLSPFYFGLCDDKEILRKTLDHLRKTLWNKAVGGVNRFEDFVVVRDWHWYTGGTGASWPLFTLWLARFYLRLGDSSSADDCLRFVSAASTAEMYIPEKVAPAAGYKEWKEHEVEYNERVLLGIAKAEKTHVSIPGYVPWACPLGWSHAEFLMLERNASLMEDVRFLGEVAGDTIRTQRRQTS